VFAQNGKKAFIVVAFQQMNQFMSNNVLQTGNRLFDEFQVEQYSLGFPRNNFPTSFSFYVPPNDSPLHSKSFSHFDISGGINNLS
jgi:hypothetical protein